MLPALIIFLLTYLLMLALPQYRPFAALGGAALFLALGAAGLWDFTLMDAARAVDFNVLLMMAGTMGTVSLFIESRMPARLAELLILRVPNVKWAVCMLALFAGVISAFVDNVATVLMVAPVGLAIARKLKISPVPVLISIAVSSNLQGAATLVGDTTSILLGGFAGMNFFHFFWMEGRPGIFFGVELGALASLGVLLFTFRHETQPISATVETEVTDTVPSTLMLLTVGIGFFGTTIGTVLAVPFTLLASRSLWKNPVVPRVGKFVLDVLRAFPELVYAIIFIKVVGPGAFAGVLAIGVHQIGMLGKLFTEEMERMDETPVEACHAVGANGVQTMFYARLPQLMPIYASLVLNHFEIAVRSASTLGLVGAGGIGATLIFAIQACRWSRVGIILLTVIATVFLLDMLTGWVRKKLR